ncbi:spindle assembly checkpoint component MAD1 [Nannizzia gypsea CBS 118893]|uniref:Spindle assembly checkpoint component MAD1 n=1 Tax=Arthroderma gypseum (strain ATCC MYA-4604 / CBS 118893) TaxID=535722 RepID=E5R2H2_ARTGP|nr:spindle assembly checkpoint component MAD1 [Nannizzia gypsea CBS 118893]EFQ97848.1 spindle assembly checkpoint component MAD1 [Nannizzia gypsea CBS 118893]
MNRSRQAQTQPTYDFLAGNSPPQMPRTPLRRSTRVSDSVVKPDVGNEELRVQISTLKYDLENIKQEKDLTALQHEKELRELHARADADFRRAQAAETSNNKTQHKIESLAEELKSTQEAAISEKSSWERRLRSLQDENETLREESGDYQSQLADQQRQYKHQIDELEAIRSALQKTLDELRNELEEVTSTLQTAQGKLEERESEVEALETENIRLKAEGTDPEALNVLKRELSEQLAQVKKFENELRPLQKSQKRVEVVEEQKIALESQLQMMKSVEAELHNAQIRNQVLEDEKRSWDSLLQGTGQEAEFESPEAIVRALVQTRIENTSLVEKIGHIQSEATEKSELAARLEDEKLSLQKELEKARASSAANASSASTSSGSESRARLRIERQRTLALKEVEYLRAQLKAFDDEETTMNVEENRFDSQKAEHIAHLEDLLNQHRQELHELHEQLSKREAEATPAADSVAPTAAARGVKRPLSPADSDAESERIAVLTRKYRAAQESFSKSEQSVKLLTKELEATKSHLSSLQAQSRTRILEFRDNPTAQAEKIKMITLKTLKAENVDLLNQIRGARANIKSVPATVLESMKLELQEAGKAVAEKEKRIRRLKEIWTAKSSEFREAVASILGYKLDFMPNGRVRVTSMFHLSPAYRHGDAGGSADGPGSMGDGEENSIIFDGENGTMKISGGPNSLFALEIRDLIKFWVEERKDIPCFLAAMTLEFYDKTTRALRL